VYAGPKSARNILTNLSPNPARPEKPGPTYNSATNRQADKFEKYNSGLGFDRLGATHFQTLGEIATLVWVATHTMGTSGLNA